MRIYDPSEINPSQYYTITEAASLVGCHRATILRDAAVGLLDYVTERKTTRPRKLFRGSTLKKYRQRTLFINH